LGPVYGQSQGKVCFYIQTASHIGPHGRGIEGEIPGQGWVSTPEILKPGVWYFLEVEKTPSYIRIGCDGHEIKSGLAGGVSPQDFLMIPTGNVVVKNGVGDHAMDGEVSDFQIYHTAPETAFTPEPIIMHKPSNPFDIIGK